MTLPVSEIVGPVVHLLLFALDQYDKNCTANGLYAEADKLLHQANNILLEAQAQPGNVARIEQARLTLHPEVASMEELEDRHLR